MENNLVKSPHNMKIVKYRRKQVSGARSNFTNMYMHILRRESYKMQNKTIKDITNTQREKNENWTPQ